MNTPPQTDTPRTDAFYKDIYEQHKEKGYDDSSHYFWLCREVGEYAHTLERELNQANASYNKACFDNTQLESKNEELRQKLAAMTVELEECKHQNGISEREIELAAKLAAVERERDELLLHWNGSLQDTFEITGKRCLNRTEQSAANNQLLTDMKVAVLELEDAKVCFKNEEQGDIYRIDKALSTPSAKRILEEQQSNKNNET